jgi:alpha-D-xyloside xylohydrolase
MHPEFLTRIFLFATLLLLPAASHAQVLGDPVDVSQDFQRMENVYFVGARVTSFDASTGQGTLQWDRYLRSTTLSFNKIDVGFTRGRANEFPGTEYDQDPTLPFSIAFVSPRTVRLRFSTRSARLTDGQSLMLAGAVNTVPSLGVVSVTVGGWFGPATVTRTGADSTAAPA